jgi:hypothetical protein
VKEIEALIARREAQIKQLESELEALRLAARLLGSETTSTAPDGKSTVGENSKARAMAAAVGITENNRNQFV